MKLITETVEEVNFLTEATAEGGKNYFIEGTFMQGDTLNRNKRVYPKHILLNEVTRYTKEYVNNNRAFGELNHPSGPTVNLDRVSHKITELHRDGNNFIGKAQILSTPMGKIAESLLKEGVCLGVSSRGIGSLRETREGHKEVGEDFMLATAADIVADPSAPDAFVRGIMEGKEWIWDGGILKEKQAEKIYKKINNLVDQKILEDYKLSLFNHFIANL